MRSCTGGRPNSRPRALPTGPHPHLPLTARLSTLSRSGWINPCQPHQPEAIALCAGVEGVRARAAFGFGFGFGPRHHLSKSSAWLTSYSYDLVVASEK